MRLRLWIRLRPAEALCGGGDMRRRRSVGSGHRVARCISRRRDLLGGEPLPQNIRRRAHRGRGYGGFDNFGPASTRSLIGRGGLCLRDSGTQSRTLLRLGSATARFAESRRAGRVRFGRSGAHRCRNWSWCVDFARCIGCKSARSCISRRVRCRVRDPGPGAVGTFLPFFFFFWRRLKIQLLLVDHSFDVRTCATVEFARVPDAIIAV